MARLARPATTTVPADSPPESCASAGAPPLASLLGFASGSPEPSTLRAMSASVAASGLGGVMATRCPAAPDSNRIARRLPHAHEIDDEDQRRAGLDDAPRTALAVRLVRRDGQPAPAADLHARDALVPALDDHADAQPELQRVAPVPRGVELLPTVVRDAHVVRTHQAARGRLGTVTDDEVLDHEVVRRGPGGGLDVRSAQLGHETSSLALVGVVADGTASLRALASSVPGSPSRTGEVPASSPHPISGPRPPLRRGPAGAGARRRAGARSRRPACGPPGSPRR